MSRTCERRRLAAAESRDVLEQRILAEIEFDEVRHIAVERLVVGDAGADCIGDGHIACQIGAHKARDPQHRGRIEHQRVEEVVVDATVDDVDALRPAGRAHEHDVVGDEEVAALDQFDAELVGEEGMFVIGRIERTRRQQDDHRLVIAGARRDRAQAGQQRVGIILDRRDAVLGEEVGHQPHRHLAVLQHIGDAGGGAGVVLEHVENVGVDAHDVDAGDMDPDVVGRAAADHFGPVIGVAQDQFGRDQPLFEDRARAIDVAQEHVQRIHPLDEAGLQPRPFRARDQAGNDVEGDKPLGGVLVAIDAEGDADAAEHIFGLGAPRGENFGRGMFEPVRDMPVEGANILLLKAHFIEKRGADIQPRPGPQNRN